jgi:phenylalanyl-tRNA synthetase beta chain
VAIRRSARSQGIRTEASTRYERGVNQAAVRIACQRALGLIVELAGGTVGTQAVTDTRPGQTETVRTLELRLERVNQVLGPINLTANDEEEPEVADLQAADVERTLTALGCQLVLSKPGVWSVTVPPYRYRDLEREIDLIEEVARLYGFNKFCDTLPSKTEPGFLSVEQALSRRIQAAFQAVGLTEVIHYSLVKAESQDQVSLVNPLLAEYSALRTELVPGLIDAFQYNLEQGNGALNAFEMGRVFWRDEEGLAEADKVAGIMGGDAKQGLWTQSGREQPMSWFEAKGRLESAFQRLGLGVEYQPDRRDAALHPGRTASLWIQGDRLGTFGQLHPQLRQQRGLPDEVYVFELDLDVMFDRLDQDERITPIFQVYSPYPASDRDIAFFASVKVSVAELERTIRKAGGKLLDSVTLFDEYLGENVPTGKRSLAFRLVYRTSDRTLKDEDVEPIHKKVRDALVEKFSVDLRS